MTLGDGHELEATGQGTVILEMKLSGETRKCKLQNVLHVPKLSYNLLSVSKVTEAGKTVKFDEAECRIYNLNKKLIAMATRVGSLYYLNCKGQREGHQIKATEEIKENIWHLRKALRYV